MAKKNREQQQPAPRQRRQQEQAQTKPRKFDMDSAVEESRPGNVMWKLGILLCVAMIVIALLFASINGGSEYVGPTDEGTPAPPATSTVPETSPQVSPEVSPEAGTGDTNQQ